MSKLRIAPDLTLPISAVTETFAVLGKRGTGKTYTAGVLVEELIKAGQHVVIIDPTDAWWGLRSSRDGKGPGLPVVIFGGPHGDLPLLEQDASIIARAIVEQSITCVLSLRHLSKKARLRFLGPLLEDLYHLKAERREPLMLVVDEADRVAPQKLMKGEGQERVLGAIDEIVRMGRSSGFGVLLITQRSAVISKDVLSQTEVLITTRTISPQDIAAVDAWIQEHDVEDKRDEFVASLPSLPAGDSWWWSPGWLNVFKHTRVREKETFDSSYTPKPGEKARAPKRLAEVDLAALKAQLAATIERAKADDPKTLKAEIAQLEKQLRAKAPAAAGPDPAAVQRAIEADRTRYIRELKRLVAGELSATTKAIDRLQRHAATLPELLHEVYRTFGQVQLALEPKDEAARGAGDREATRAEIAQFRKDATPLASAIMSTAGRGSRAPARLAATPRSPDPAAAGELSRGQLALLNAAAGLEVLGLATPHRSPVAVLGGVSPTSSATERHFAALIRAGYFAIAGDGLVQLTAAASAVVERDLVPPTLDEYHDAWRAKLSGGRVKLFDAAIEHRGETLTRAELAQAAGVSPTSSATERAFAWLISLDLLAVAGKGEVTSGKLLFPEGLR